MNDFDQKRPWLNRNILGFGLGSFLTDLSHEMTTLILPLFVASLVGPGIAPFYVGIITGFSDAGASFTRIMFGYLSDVVHRRKPFILCGYALSSIFISLIGFAHHVEVVFLGRFVAWIGKGMREPARDALIAESVAPLYYGRAFGFHRAMDSLGALFGPLVTFMVLPFVSFKSVFFISFIPSFLSVVVIWALTRDVLHNKHEKRMALKIRLQVIPPKFWIFILILFLFSCGNYHLTLIVLRAQELLGMKNSLFASGTVVLLYAVLNIARAVGEYSIGWLSDFYSRKNLLALFGFALFGLASLMLSAFESKVFLPLIFVLSGLSTGSYSSLEKAYAADLLPQEVRGTGYGLLYAVRGIGALISGIVVGTLWSFYLPSVAFLFSSIISFCAAIFLLLL